jgi:hypothetical protein
LSASPPLGYSLRQTPESRSDTYTYQVADKAVSITKSAIQGFLDSFLNPKGANRGYLGATISPEGLQYVTELTYDDEMKADPNKRKTYLAKFFQENTGRLPSILIIDGGIEDGDPGINALDEGIGFRNQWRAKSVYLVKVGLSILVASYSEEDTSTLSGTIFFILTQLVDAIKAHVIRLPKTKWEVRLPLSGVTAAQMANVSVEGDVKSQIWTRTIDIKVDFESIIEFQAPIVKFTLPAIGIVATSEGGPLPTFLNLSPNQKIPLGQDFTLLIQNMQLKHSLGISDPNIALISSEPPWYIQPRRQGTVLLYLFDSTLPTGQNPATGKKNNLVLDIPFKVTL